MSLSRLLVLLLLLGSGIPVARAHHVDPYEVIDRAFEAYKTHNDYAEARAIMSDGLRRAPHDGRLDPEFGLFFSVYSDLVRYDGNPSFALLLAEQGLALVDGADRPDADVRNTLLVSRAHALADLGRYGEAVETAAITALWMGTRFGDAAREDLQREAEAWARKASSGNGELPEAGRLAVELLQKAEAALAAQDTATAIALASRATLPQGAGLSENAVRLVNAWSRQVVGAAYGLEGRHRAALNTLLGAADLLVEEPWDRRTRPRLMADVTPRLAWDVFIHIAMRALDLDDAALASAALDVAADHASTPNDRYQLLVQQAALLMRDDDPVAVAAAFARSEQEARAAGDEENAALARFYASVMSMNGATAQQARAEAARTMLSQAGRAADAAAGNPQQVEYILTTAAWQAMIHGGPVEAVLPVARRAFDVFRERQRLMAGYETGQEAVRRERRRFLETYVDALYETGPSDPQAVRPAPNGP
ncbi:MAG: hypothetical protein ABTQ31_02860 [Rhizobiaceae bacterium]